MSAVRVIVNITAPSVEDADKSFAARVERGKNVETTESGCLQYEIFRSGQDPAKLVLLEHWESRAVYDQHWTSQIAREGLPQRKPGASPSRVEIYGHETFEVVDGVWVPTRIDARSATIRWPG